MREAAALALIVATLRAAAPLTLAGLGELLAERAGVLNLGVEGMMLMGAVGGFIGAAATGSALVGLAAAVLAGMAMAALFAVLVLYLQANQVATGLALSIFGVGLSAMIGVHWESQPIPGLATRIFPHLAQAPPALQQLLLSDPLVWLARLAPVARLACHGRRQAGLRRRAVGESPEVAHALGYRVRRLRFAAVLFGGAMAGLGGAALSLAYTPMWTENMVAGRGWIALALVVFSGWNPVRLLGGALLFGFVTIAGFEAEALGLAASPPLLAALPYVATIFVLVVISGDRVRQRRNTPASLGKPFHQAG